MNKFRRKKKAGKSKLAVWSWDWHVPCEDKRAVQLLYDVTRFLDKKYGVDEFGVGGDLADCYGVTSHDKDVSISISFRNEVKAVDNRCNEIDELVPKAKKVYLEGNHEERFIRYINKKAPDLYGLIDFPTLIHMDHRKDWTWVPYGPYQKYNVLDSALIARHAPMGGGEHVAAGSVKKAGTSVAFGHVHKIQEFQVVTLNGENHRGIAVGCLCDKMHKAMQYVKNHHQWAQSFLIVRVQPNGHWFAQNVHIIDYECCVDGQIFKA